MLVWTRLLTYLVRLLHWKSDDQITYILHSMELSFFSSQYLDFVYFLSCIHADRLMTQKNSNVIVDVYDL
jgi:hypothetical protein